MLSYYGGIKLKVSYKMKYRKNFSFNYSFKDFNPNWVVRLTMYWQAEVIRFTYMWELWIITDHLLREKKMPWTQIYQIVTCQINRSQMLISDGFYHETWGYIYDLILLLFYQYNCHELASFLFFIFIFLYFCELILHTR